MPLQGDRRATTVTQGDCPGLGAAAPSGRIGEGGAALSGRMDEGWLGFCAINDNISLAHGLAAGRVRTRLLPLMTISSWLLALLGACGLGFCH